MCILEVSLQHGLVVIVVQIRQMVKNRLSSLLAGIAVRSVPSTIRSKTVTNPERVAQALSGRTPLKRPLRKEVTDLHMHYVCKGLMEYNMLKAKDQIFWECPFDGTHTLFTLAPGEKLPAKDWCPTCSRTFTIYDPEKDS